jgi:hypothetical protein
MKYFLKKVVDMEVKTELVMSSLTKIISNILDNLNNTITYETPSFIIKFSRLNISDLGYSTKIKQNLIKLPSFSLIMNPLHFNTSIVLVKVNFFLNAY